MRLNKASRISLLIAVLLISTFFYGSILPVSARARAKAKLSIEITADVTDQLAPGSIKWTIIVTNTGDVTFDKITIYDSRTGLLLGFSPLPPDNFAGISYEESDLPGGKYLNIATVIGEYAIGSFVIETTKISCKVLTG